MTPDPATLPTRERLAELRRSVSVLDDDHVITLDAIDPDDDGDTVYGYGDITAGELRLWLDAADRAEAAEALLKERDERLRVLGLRICSQCGQPFEARACGPTHALIAHERAESCPSLLVAGTPVPPPQPSADVDAQETRWLVERTIDGRPAWANWNRGTDKGLTWDYDASKATRYEWAVAARRVADDLRKRMGDATIRETQHIFIYRAQPSALDTALAKLGEKVRAVDAGPRDYNNLLKLLAAAREVVAAMGEGEK